MVLAFVKKSGLSIRYAGGVYFIPPQLFQTLDALCAMLRLLENNTVWTLPVADLGEASVTLGALAKETLDEEVATVEAERAAFDARDVQTRDSTLEGVSRSSRRFVAGALAFRADSIHENLAALEAEVRYRLFGEPPLRTIQLQLDDRAPAPFDADVGF